MGSNQVSFLPSSITMSAMDFSPVLPDWAWYTDQIQFTGDHCSRAQWIVRWKAPSVLWITGAISELTAVWLVRETDHLPPSLFLLGSTEIMSCTGSELKARLFCSFYLHFFVYTFGLQSVVYITDICLISLWCIMVSGLFNDSLCGQ